MRNPHPRENQASKSSSGANITTHESSADGSEHDQKDHTSQNLKKSCIGGGNIYNIYC